MSTFDLNLISLYRINGQEWPLLPGLLAVNPPRKTARGREQDRLLVYLTLAGNVMYSSAEYSQITAQIAERFYNTPGSMTFGLKAAVESLNGYLAERNMKSNGNGQYSIGALVLAALRGNSLYIVQCGPTHAYWRTGNETRHFHDATLAGKGLGLSQTATMYFSQAGLKVNDRILFCTALPPKWDKPLSEERWSTSLEATRRRLLAITDTNVSAVLIQIGPGANGAMNIQHPAKDGAPPIETDQPPAEAEPSAEQILPLAKDAEAAAEIKFPSPPADTALKRLVARRKRLRRPGPLLTPEQHEKLKRTTQTTARSLALSIQSGRKLSQKGSSAVEKLIPRLLPGEQTPSTIPALWLAFIAIAIPLLMLTVGTLVYYEFGQPALFEAYYQQAVDAADRAQSEQNPTALRTDWKTVLSMLDKADAEFPVPERASETLKLRRQAQNALDKLDHILRVNYRPAFKSPLRPMRVTHMAATDIDVYMLDDISGSVIRGNLNGQNYEADPGFESCKPGRHDGVVVSRLIDIVALPRSNASGATLLAIDESGNLLYCASGETPKAASLQRPDASWTQITAIAYDANTLYLLDAPGRAVWVFFGTTALQFPEKPYFFFESQVPSGLEQAIDMTVNGDDLYLLHQDGHLTTCTLSRIQASPTSCTDPAIFTDTRAGHQNGVRLTGAVFSQITFTSPPDPAVALLEPYPDNQAIFRFSARALELQNQIRPAAGKDNPLPAQENLTAMAFSPNKVLFVFVGGQLYFAVNIP